MCCSGSRCSRRAMTSQYRASKSASFTECSSPRFTPCTNAASSSASLRGEGTPASASRWVACATSASSRFTHSSVSYWVVRRCSLCGRQLRSRVRVDAGLDHRVEVAVEHLVKVVRLETDAVVRNAVLREVVRADLLGAVDGAALAAPGVGGVALRLLLRRGEQP